MPMTPCDLHVLGLMSGTSLDGLDLCVVRLKYYEQWTYDILDGQTIPYPEELRSTLETAHLAPEKDLPRIDRALSEFFERNVLTHVDTNKLDLIASHGHTIRHLPEEGITLQLGDPRPLAKKLGIPVVYDFRTQDLGLGGQGAPLVPVGDQFLFPEYDFCLNLGGFANYSADINGQRIASDICPVNTVMNALVADRGIAFDDRGMIAASGACNQQLLEQLNSISFYGQHAPKSLGREWVDQEIWPLLKSSGLCLEDRLATFANHVAAQVGQAIPQGRVLVTGGGAYNDNLLSLFGQYSSASWEVPETKLVDFKEALVFALLGVLRIHEQINVFSSVTGASNDHCSGEIWRP